MRITRDNIDEQNLYNAGGYVTVITHHDSGMFVRYCGSGKIIYKIPVGIIKSVNAFTSNVWLENL